MRILCFNLLMVIIQIRNKKIKGYEKVYYNYLLNNNYKRGDYIYKEPWTIFTSLVALRIL
jgi:hypothetical protein